VMPAPDRQLVPSSPRTCHRRRSSPPSRRGHFNLARCRLVLWSLTQSPLCPHSALTSVKATPPSEAIRI
jgi:hypothetical protein